jgi:hypothetical protein
MGAWGAGLYSNDLALDLRSTIRAASRLPFDGERLLEIACDAFRDEATNLRNEDHSTFWLVLADQFHKRGIRSETAREKALTLIDTGADAEVMRGLGMSEPLIRKRTAKLRELRDLLVSPLPGRKAPLSKPKPFLMDVGDIYTYPTLEGDSINPYFRDYRTSLNWEPNAWSAFAVIDRGKAFDYVPWYTILTLRHEVYDYPVLANLRHELWVLDGAATCSKTHFQRLELEPLGTVSIDRKRVEKCFTLPNGLSAAIYDVSIANKMHSLAEKRQPHDFGRRGHIERLPAATLQTIISADVV